MAAYNKGLTTKGGRIRVKCVRCQKVKYHSISPRIRKKTVRCPCGKTMQCTMNRRVKMRESCSVHAQVMPVSGPGIVIQVKLRDISETGIGFTIIKGSDERLISPGKYFLIQYRPLSGSLRIRKICIMSRVTHRAGASFTDITRI